MARFIPIIAVSRGIMERFLKARAGLVQRQVWVKQGSGRKGHYRMQWVDPATGLPVEEEHNKQFDLFASPGADGAPDSEKDRRHAEEMDAADRYNETPEGKKEARNQRLEVLAEKISKQAEKIPLIDQITVTKVSKRQIEIKYGNETYAMGAHPYNPLALKTIQPDGKAWYSYGGKLGPTGEISLSEKSNLEDALRKKYGKFDQEKQMYEYSDSGKADNKNPADMTDAELDAEIAKGDKVMGDVSKEPSNKQYHRHNDLMEEKINRNRKAAGKPKEKIKKDDGKYQIYHSSLTGAIDEVIAHLEKQGLFMDEEEIFNTISTGPRKPGDGKTNRYMLALYDEDGIPAKKAVQFQVYGMGNGRYELNMYTTPAKETIYGKNKAQIRGTKDGGVMAAANWAFDNGYIDTDGVMPGEVRGLVEKLKKAGALSEADEKEMIAKEKAIVAKDADRGDKTQSDSSWLITAFQEGLYSMGGYDPSVGTREAREMARFVAAAINKYADKPEKGEKKPFEDMTFEAKKTTGRPENVAETVRDVLSMSSGSVAQFAGSARYEDIDKFRDAAAKWAYENDKIGTGFDILAEYRVHGKAKEAPSVGADIDSVSMRDMWEVLDPGPYSDNIAAYEDAAKKIKESAAAWAKTNKKTGEGMALIKEYMASKGMKKSIVGSFRAGLAKALGKR